MGRTTKIDVIIYKETGREKVIFNEIRDQYGIRIFIFFFLLLFTFSSYAQTTATMTLKSEAVMYEKSTAVSKKILTIEAGKTIKAFEKTNGYFRVDYNGTVGYINEMFLQRNNTNTVSVNNTAKINSTSKVEVKSLKSEAQMKESDSPLSNTIYTLPAGTQVKTLSLEGGYYKVEYKGKTGYINEIFFQTVISRRNSSTNTIKNNSSSTNSNISNNEIKYVAGTSKPSFQNMLAGVKYAVIINYPKINGHIPAFNALFEYLQAMEFQVEYMNDNYDSPSHLCEEIWTYISFDYDLQKFSNIKWHFVSPCNGYTWELSSNKVARDGLYDNPKNNFYNVLRGMYEYKKPIFNQSYRIELPKRLTNWTEHKIKQEFQLNGAEQIEGIYENSSSSNRGEAKYKLAVKKILGKFHLIYLSGANNTGNWQEAEVKAILEPTATPHFYKAKWIMADKSENNDYYISFESGMMNVTSSDKDRSLYIKLYPTFNDNITSNSNTPSSGTGFAITSNGLIVTNHHVIDGAKTIKVRGINGDFNRTYSAQLVSSDKNNDLAILKIDDYNFSNLGTIPYVIKPVAANVGDNIFVLGYPLRATMGDEVKLTNGIISSKTGFKGDITSYQISAPVQPGNSGGPLFDNQGNIVGIINAKHALAENASYAVKANYLLSLIDLLDNQSSLQKTSQLTSKSLSQQVEIVKKFVYIIEVN